MRYLFEEFADTFFAIIIAAIVLSTFLSGFTIKLLDDSYLTIQKEAYKDWTVSNAIPVSIDKESFYALDSVIVLNETFDFRDRTGAFNSNGEDISSYISVINMESIDSSEEKDLDIDYLLNYNGEKMSIRAKLHVVDKKEITSNEELG